MNKILRIGYPDTTIGLWQATLVESLIKPSGYRTKTIPFTNNTLLEKSIIDGSTELIVSSATALPIDIAEYVELIAFTERRAVNDVVIGRSNTSLANDPISVGVTSALKSAFTNHYYPKASTIIDPNLNSCIQKLNQGKVDVLVMSHEEAEHQGQLDNILERIETSYFVPCSGQGSIAVQCHKKMGFANKEVLQHWVNHEETEDCIRAERSFLKALAPSPDMLVFAYAQFEGAVITLKAGIISKDGKSLFKAKKSAILGESRELGKKVALEVARLFSEQKVYAY